MVMMMPIMMTFLRDAIGIKRVKSPATLYKWRETISWKMVMIISKWLSCCIDINNTND